MRKAIAAILLTMVSLGSQAGERSYEKLYRNLPVEMQQPEQPNIPSKKLYLSDFIKGSGALSGKSREEMQSSDCSDAIAKAISMLEKMGGGSLVIGAGTWVTGPIELKSRIDLHLEAGATLLFTNDKSAYFPKDAEGRPIVKGRALPCIRAEKCEDISITGDGVLDGNGQWWRYAKRDKYESEEWNRLLEMGGSVSEDGKLWFPYNLKGLPNLTGSPQEEEAIRNHMIILKRCKRIRIEGVTVRNSPKFHINPAQCEDVILENLKVTCPWNAQNGDGIDIGNCRRVLVSGCLVDCGDDGICMKGGSGEKGLKAGPCRDILICGNTVLHAHGGFVIGSDFSGGMENIVVRDCIFDGSDIGLRFKSMAGRGGRCKNIYINNIRMRNIVDAAISFDCGYADVTYKTLASGDGKGAEFLPDFSDIHISNVRCNGCGTGIFARGMQGYDCVYDIFISDCIIRKAKKNLDVDESTTRLNLSDVRISF